jgi:hypothetical protein
MPIGCSGAQWQTTAKLVSPRPSPPTVYASRLARLPARAQLLTVLMHGAK